MKPCKTVDFRDERLPASTCSRFKAVHDSLDHYACEHCGQVYEPPVTVRRVGWTGSPVTGEFGPVKVRA